MGVTLLLNFPSMTSKSLSQMAERRMRISIEQPIECTLPYLVPYASEKPASLILDSGYQNLMWVAQSWVHLERVLLSTAQRLLQRILESSSVCVLISANIQS